MAEGICMRRVVVTGVSVVVVAVAMAGAAGAAAAGLVGDDGQVASAVADGPVPLAAGSVCTGDAGSGPFPDVAGDHRFCADIEWFVASGMTTGYADGTFRPVSPVTRQAMAAFLWRWAGEPANGLVGPFFADVDADHPYFDAIQWMAEAGLATGTSGVGGAKPTFGPGVAVSRQAMAAFLWRFFEEPTPDAAAPTFADVEPGHRFGDPIQWMAEAWLATGTPAPPGLPQFRPGDPVSRQAMAAFFHRAEGLVSGPCSTGAAVQRLSVDGGGGEADGASRAPAPSADGRFVAFVSEATDLVPGDTNGVADVFVKDCATGQVRRASVAADGTQAELASWGPDLSPDGRYVVFSSSARNLVADRTTRPRTHRHDLLTGATVVVGEATIGGWWGAVSRGAVSAGGRYVAYGIHEAEVEVRDLETGETWRPPGSEGGPDGAWRQEASLSDDGRFLTWRGGGFSLGPGGWFIPDVVARFDRETGTVQYLSVTPSGARGSMDSGEPRQSGDGSTVVFTSFAPDLVPGDTNGVADVFAWDAATGELERVSVDSDGTQRTSASGSPSVSADGRFVSFVSDGQVLVRDRVADQTFVVPHPDVAAPDAPLTAPVLTDDGLHLVAASSSATLGPGDTNGAADVFRIRIQQDPLPLEHVADVLVPGLAGDPWAHDFDARWGRPPYRWSADGLPAGWTIDPSSGVLTAEAPTAGTVEGEVTVTDADGVAATRTVVVEIGPLVPCSAGPDLVSADAMGRPVGTLSGDGSAPALSADGHYVAFASTAALVPGDTNGVADVYVRDCLDGRITRASVDTDGGQLSTPSRSPSISDDGRRVAFQTGEGLSKPYARVLVYDRAVGTSVGTPCGGRWFSAGGPTISGDGTTVIAWAGWTDGDLLEPYWWGGVIWEVGSACSQLTGFPSGLSHDGQEVAFTSDDDWGDDTNGLPDVFVRDRSTGVVARVSVATGGAQSSVHREYDGVDLSADGRYVVFLAGAGSSYSDLAPDLTTTADLFVHDRQTGTTTVASIGADGTQVDVCRILGLAAGAGQLWFFGKDPLTPDGLCTLLRRDLVTGVTRAVQLPPAVEAALRWYSSVSSDGSTLAFPTGATNLVDPPDTNGEVDVYRVVLPEPQPVPCPADPIVRVSVDREGGEADGASSEPAPSADGSRVAFVSEATDLVPGDTNGVADVFVKDCTTGEVWRASVASDGTQADAPSSAPDLSPDGRWVVFTSQAANLVAGALATEVYRHDLETGDTVRASGVTSPAWAYDAGVSADGRHVISTRAAYQDGPNTVVQDIQVRDLETGQSWSVPPALESAYGCVLTSSDPSLSDDGRFGALWSETVTVLPECVPSGRQIVWFDRVAGTAEVISLDREGTLGGGDEPRISSSGTTVVFTSAVTDLVDGDTNGVADVFAWDAATGEIERVSVGSDGAQRSAASGSPSVSADGRYVAFASDGQVLVRDRAAGQTFVVPGPGAGTSDASLTAPVLTDDALQLVAASAGTTLVAGDVNGASDVFRLRTDHELLALEHVVEPLPLASVGEPYNHDLDAIGGVPPYAWSADGLPVDWAIDPDTGELSAVDPQVGSVEATVTVTDNVGTAVTRAITVVVADPPPCGPGPVAVSTDPDGAPSGGSAPDLTADGRYVAFTSEAPLLPTDTDAVADVYVRDCDTGRLDLVSVAPGGAPLTASSGHASISDDGRFVAFGSGWNAFVRDRLAATTTELTRCDPQSGTEWDAQGPAISADGSTVVVWRGNSTVPSGSSPYWTPVAYELGGGCEHLTVAGTSFADLAGLPLAVSGDGGTVAFVSFAALVDDDTNDTFDVYVLERATDAVTRVSVATGGGQSTGLVFYGDLSMSRDGRFVTFSAELLSPAFSDLAPDATDERDTFVHDRVAGTTALVSIGPDGQQVTPSPTGASISDEGRYVAFAGGTAGPHVLVRDLVLGETVQADLATGGGSSDSSGANPVLSADGRTVVFWSNATNLVDPPDTNGLPDVYRVVLPDSPPVP